MQPQHGQFDAGQPAPRVSPLLRGRESAGPLPAAKVLVADDLPANRLVLRRLLAGLGAEIIEADSGSEALRACLENQFALILLDVQMPGMDGFEVAEVLSGDPESRDTPIIFITAAYADDLNRLKGYAFGAVDYIAKPINDQILLSKVKVFLELWRSRQRLEQVMQTLADRNKKLEEEIAERRRIETLVRHQAQHDALTGLPNRILFLDRLETALDRATRHRESFALLYIDIDGFKPVNDNHGHAVGDLLLREIGQRMVKGTRKTDTVARLGGDEFAVILEEVASKEAALQVGLKLCDALAAAFTLDTPDGERLVRVGASVGVAVFPDQGRQRDELINAADAAMYSAKRAGKNHAALAQTLTNY